MALISPQQKVELLSAVVPFFFSLDGKETKDQDCKNKSE
jgi:hypothetical protein